METEKYKLKKGSSSAALVEKAIAAIYSAGSRQNEILSLPGTLDSLKQILYGRPEMLSDLASCFEIKNDGDVSITYQAVYDAVKRYYLGVDLIIGAIGDDYSKRSKSCSVRVITPDDSKPDDPPSFPPLAPKQVLNPKINERVKEKSLEQLCQGIIC